MNPITPKQAVEKLIEIMLALPNLSADIIYDAMQSAGIPSLYGHLAYTFTQIAWGNVAISRIGIKPCDEYYLLDGEGNLIDQGLCSKNAYYLTASELAEEYKLTQAFGFMAQTSSAVRTLDASLKQGSKLEHLMMMPSVIFLGTPTEAGMNKLNQLMSDYSAKLRELYPPKSDTSIH